MLDGAVGAGELAVGETKLRHLDRAFGSDVSRAVAVDLDELEIDEHVSLVIERSGGRTVLERQEGPKLSRHGRDANPIGLGAGVGSGPSVAPPATCRHLPAVLSRPG